MGLGEWDIHFDFYAKRVTQVVGKCLTAETHCL